MAIRTGVAEGLTIHNGCTVRASDSGQLGWCTDHRERVYRAGIDWHTDQDNPYGVVVLHFRRDRLSDRVTVNTPLGVSDRELALAAGYGSEHFGYDVTRYDDGTAAVSLHKD